MAIPAKGTEDILSDVVDDARADRQQRWIAWLCALLTVAALVAAWQML